MIPLRYQTKTIIATLGIIPNETMTIILINYSVVV